MLKKMPCFTTTRPARFMQESIESDEDTWESDEEPKNDVVILEQIQKEFKDQQEKMQKYLRSKQDDCELLKNRWVDYLDKEIFIILLDILEKMFIKAKETKSMTYHKSTYNPMDFIAEQLWNLNPRHPERKDNWTNLFDMDWVKKSLKTHPRPFFPFSWIWSKDYAALKIQAYMRGYWVRRRDDVQEVRQFWRALEEDRLQLKETTSTIPPWCVCREKNEDNECYH
nr:IQ domain-containing protein K-like isoform X1 [Onthophagus taurus]